MKRIIFMGASGSGKTTLCRRLAKQNLKYIKTQAIEFYDDSIDTPGEYMENRHYYSALTVTAADADVIGLVADGTRDMHYLPPGFAAMFAKEVIGIITKVNLAENTDCAEAALKSAGASLIFKVDTPADTGIQKLISYLEE